MPPVPSWSIEAFCTSQSQSMVDWSGLPTTSQEFLHALQLPSFHPFCQQLQQQSYSSPADVPLQGPLLHNDHLETVWDVLVTAWCMGTPSLLAMAELWLRLFAAILAPLGVLHLINREIRNWAGNAARTTRSLHNGASNNMTRSSSWLHEYATCFLTMLSSLVLMTDDLYNLEWVRPDYGISLFVLSMLLSFRRIVSLQHLDTDAPVVLSHARKIVMMLPWLFLARLAFALTYDSVAGAFHFGSLSEHVSIQEGLYYDQSNTPVAEMIAQHWPEQHRRYHPNDKNSNHTTITAKATTTNRAADVLLQPTPWMLTGDSRTGLPFLFNVRVPDPVVTRVWLPVDDGDEVVALDICFPANGHYDPRISGNQSDPPPPLYLVLHGLNGGTHEEFVKDFILRRTGPDENATVVVMIARGLMDLPVRGWHTFHGARWTDAATAAISLRRTLQPQQILAGVGYSMGAIILSNYVTRAGPDCALDSAVAISGGLDMRAEINFHRALRLWQPIVAQELRDKFVVGKFGERVRSRLTKEQMKFLMRATHISDIDRVAIVVYHGFRDLDHYYSEMSALGDISPDEFHRPDPLPASRRIHNISIPFCVVHALDDPLVTWRTVAGNQGWMHPDNLTRTGSGNLVLLLTKRGGHVGWPLGWIPIWNRWKWMNDAAMGFSRAVLLSKFNSGLQ